MSDGTDLYRITQRTQYLWAVEMAHPIHGWISVADCLLPWVDVMRITEPIRMDAAPTPKGVRPFGEVEGDHPQVPSMRITQPIQPTAPPTRKGGRLFGAGVKGSCEWCGQNPHRYLAVSDGGRQYICEVCALDVTPTRAAQ